MLVRANSAGLVIFHNLMIALSWYHTKKICSVDFFDLISYYYYIDLFNLKMRGMLLYESSAGSGDFTECCQYFAQR